MGSVFCDGKYTVENAASSECKRFTEQTTLITYIIAVAGEAASSQWVQYIEQIMDIDLF